MRKYLSEFLGTAFLVIFSTVALIYVSTFSIGQLFDVMAVLGLAIAMLMFVFGPFSNGGHFNPAVSLAAALNKQISWKTFGGYLLSQVIGAIVGLFVAVQTLVPVINTQMSSSSTSSSSSSVSATKIYETLEPAASVASLPVSLTIEAVFTFLLVFVTVLAFKKMPNQAPVVAGLTLTLSAFVTYPLTGGLLNPARAFAPAIMTGLGSSAHLWFFLLIEVIAAALAGLAVKYFAKDEAAA
ncbi:MIP/aquaporin family protein [Fructobacillus fructosus]|uniref:Glycerol uptake facilitator or related aquaporin (Major Intrinsic protein Family) (GlpF) n=1 Tax=Fructobacillus fructosus TaxID=1631 RepID=A0ABM9MWY3_9LACO|nr:Glycerol uptake facilitator or related aquaporin (Major Intrinsic protein Family) (GlpF) [Fructobacillus fructosus]